MCATTPSNDTAVVYEAGIFYKCLTAALVVPSPCRTHGSELSAAAFCDTLSIALFCYKIVRRACPCDRVNF